MDCGEVRGRLLDYQRGRLDEAAHAAVAAHLAACPGCARAEAAEAALTEALEARLPQHPASLALKRRLAAGWPAGPAAPARARPAWWRRPFALVPALAIALLVVVAAPATYRGWVGRPDRAAGSLVAEAVNDHLRIVSGHHPLEVEAGGLHQVKPWFAGQLDFAPVVGFGGDEEFPLLGGAVEYFLDRRAAVFVYGRRLHRISLLVVPAAGLPWPAADRPQARSERGFNLLLWRAGELGYALVSDVDPADLRALAARLAAPR